MIAWGSGMTLVTMNWTGPFFNMGGGATVLGCDDGGTLSNEDIAGLIVGGWTAHLAAVQDESVVLDSVRVESELFAHTEAVGAAGGYAMEGVTCNTALLISKSADGKGRRYRGRNYWPGFLEDANVNERGQVAPAHMAALGPLFGAFFENLVTAGGEWRIPQNEPVPPPAGPADPTPPVIPWPIVTAHTIQSTVATQRRRLRR